MSETPSLPTPPAPASPTPPPAAPLAAPSATNGFGIAALILGILALLGAPFPIINIFSGILAFVGLILGIIGLTRKGTKKGTSIAGAVISGVALLTSIIFGIVYIVGIGAALNNAVDTPAITSEPTTTPSEAPVVDPGDGSAGSFGNPVPVGTAVTYTINGVDTWKVTLQSSVLNANDLVAAADPASPAPRDGYQYALVNFRFEHIGPGEGTPSDDLSVLFGDTTKTGFYEVDTVATTPSPSWRDIVGIQQASIAGNAIVEVPTATAEGGVWAINVTGSDVVIFYAGQ